MVDIFLPIYETSTMKASLKSLMQIIKSSEDPEMDLETLEDPESENLPELEQEALESESLLKDSPFYR